VSEAGATAGLLCMLQSLHSCQACKLPLTLLLLLLLLLLL
jgi:hypothetical protein